MFRNMEMAKCCCAGLGWDRSAFTALCSGSVLKMVLITTRMFSLLHGVMAFSASHPTRERAGGKQEVGQVTPDPK